MITVTIGNKTFEIDLMAPVLPGDVFIMKISGEVIQVRIPPNSVKSEEVEWLIIDETPYEVSIDRDFRWIKSEFGLFPLDVRDSDTRQSISPRRDGRIKAPIPGLITRVVVKIGDRVEAGQGLFVLEAMKMENEIRANLSGKIKTLHVKAGQGVSLHELLAEIEPA